MPVRQIVLDTETTGLFPLEGDRKSDTEAAVITELVKNSKFRVHSLDHLCKYYDISLSTREKNHGALIDCQLLAQVYSHLKQAQENKAIRSNDATNASVTALSIFPPAKRAKMTPDSELGVNRSMTGS